MAAHDDGGFHKSSAPLASVVVCVYNRPLEIAQCLRSLLNQDYRPLEIVVVDDASSDDTPSIIEEFKEQAHNAGVLMTVVRNPKNRGVAGARNEGIKQSRGEFVLCTDSDCVAAPDWVSNMVRVLSQPGVMAASGLCIETAPRTWGDWAFAGTTRIVPGGWQGRFLVGGNMGFRREILPLVEFDERIKYWTEDEDLALRLLARNYRIEFAKDARVFHYHSLTTSKYIKLGWYHGQAAAYLWWKHGRLVGRDIVFLVLSVASLPLFFLDPMLGSVPLLLLSLHVCAHIFNERAYKGKSWLTTFYVLPLVLLYTGLKTVSVIWWWLRNGLRLAFVSWLKARS